MFSKFIQFNHFLIYDYSLNAVTKVAFQILFFPWLLNFKNVYKVSSVMMQSISLDKPVGAADSVTDNLSDREYINKGLNFWLNNEPKEAEFFFFKRRDRTSVLAGYSFVLCMVLKMEFIWNFGFIPTKLNSIQISPYFS